jgi:hypothetical protein
VSKGRFAARVRELVAGQPMLERVVEPMLFRVATKLI